LSLFIAGFTVPLSFHPTTPPSTNPFAPSPQLPSFPFSPSVFFPQFPPPAESLYNFCLQLYPCYWKFPPPPSERFSETPLFLFTIRTPPLPSLFPFSLLAFPAKNSGYVPILDPPFSAVPTTRIFSPLAPDECAPREPIPAPPWPFPPFSSARVPVFQEITETYLYASFPYVSLSSFRFFTSASVLSSGSIPYFTPPPLLASFRYSTCPSIPPHLTSSPVGSNSTLQTPFPNCLPSLKNLFSSVFSPFILLCERSSYSF